MVGVDSLSDGTRGSHSTLNAVWNSCSVVCGACKKQAWNVCEGMFYLGDSLAVAEVVLGISPVPVISPGEDGCGCDPHDGAQFFAGEFDEGGVILFGEVFGERTAYEDAKENRVLRSAVRELLG